MELLFLGTSAGVPTRSRNVSATAIKSDKSRRWCLVDCGEGTQHRLLHAALSLGQLDAILITHLHGDHCYGLPGLLASASMTGRQAPLALIGPRPLEAFVKAIQAATGLHLAYELRFLAIESLAMPFETADFTVEAAALSHSVLSYAYGFSEKNLPPKLDTHRLEALHVPRGPDWGRLQHGEDVVLEDGTRITSSEVLLPKRTPRKIVIGGDNDTPALLESLCRDAQVLVHEATYTQAVVERLGTDNQHSTAARVARFAQRLGLPNLVLSHFSPRYQLLEGAIPGIRDIAQEAAAHYQGRLFLAEDLARYRLAPGGELSRLDGMPSAANGSSHR